MRGYVAWVEVGATMCGPERLRPTVEAAIRDIKRYCPANEFANPKDWKRNDWFRVEYTEETDGYCEVLGIAVDMTYGIAYNDDSKIELYPLKNKKGA